MTESYYNVIPSFDEIKINHDKNEMLQENENLMFNNLIKIVEKIELLAKNSHLFKIGEKSLMSLTDPEYCKHAQNYFSNLSSVVDVRLIVYHIEHINQPIKESVIKRTLLDTALINKPIISETNNELTHLIDAPDVIKIVFDDFDRYGILCSNKSEADMISKYLSHTPKIEKVHFECNDKKSSVQKKEKRKVKKTNIEMPFHEVLGHTQNKLNSRIIKLKESIKDHNESEKDPKKTDDFEINKLAEMMSQEQSTMFEILLKPQSNIKSNTSYSHSHHQVYNTNQTIYKYKLFPHFEKTNVEFLDIFDGSKSI